MTNEKNVCSSCGEILSDSNIDVCPGCEHEFASRQDTVAAAEHEELAKLLPPKFLIYDPDFDTNMDGDHVFLPDGKGGITSVKRNVVKVKHKGQTVELIALSAEKKRQWQLIWNFIWIFAGILFLALVFSMI